MGLHKLWDLKSGSILIIGGVTYTFTNLKDLEAAFEFKKSPQADLIIDKATFLELEDGTFKLLPFRNATMLNR